MALDSSSRTLPTSLRDKPVLSAMLVNSSDLVNASLTAFGFVAVLAALVLAFFFAILPSLIVKRLKRSGTDTTCITLWILLCFSRKKCRRAADDVRKYGICRYFARRRSRQRRF